MSDLYEIEAGKIASEKGQSEAVKKFGQQMVEAHSKTSEELKGIVQAEKLDVKLPAKLNKKNQKMIDALNAAKPQDFDKVYAEAAGQCPQKGGELFDGYAEEGDNDALKQFAANTLPTIKQHRDEAAKLRAIALRLAHLPSAQRLYRKRDPQQPARFMALIRRARTTFQRFVESEAAGGLVLMASAALGMVVGQYGFRRHLHRVPAHQARRPRRPALDQ